MRSLNLREVRFDEHLAVCGPNAAAVSSAARDVLQVRPQARHTAGGRAELEEVSVDAPCNGMHIGRDPVPAIRTRPPGRGTILEEHRRQCVPPIQRQQRRFPGIGEGVTAGLEHRPHLPDALPIHCCTSRGCQLLLQVSCAVQLGRGALLPPLRV